MSCRRLRVGSLFPLPPPLPLPPPPPHPAPPVQASPARGLLDLGFCCCRPRPLRRHASSTSLRCSASTTAPSTDSHWCPTLPQASHALVTSDTPAPHCVDDAGLFRCSRAAKHSEVVLDDGPRMRGSPEDPRLPLHWPTTSYAAQRDATLGAGAGASLRWCVAIDDEGYCTARCPCVVLRASDASTTVGGLAGAPQPLPLHALLPTWVCCCRSYLGSPFKPPSLPPAPPVQDGFEVSAALA